MGPKGCGASEGDLRPRSRPAYRLPAMSISLRLPSQGRVQGFLSLGEPENHSGSRAAYSRETGPKPPPPKPLLTTPPPPLTSNNTAQTNQNRLPTSLRGLSVKACILGLLYYFQIHTQTGEGVKMCPEPLDYSEQRGSERAGWGWWRGAGRWRRAATVKMFDATELKTILCQAECLPRRFPSDDKHLGMCHVLLLAVLPPQPFFSHMVSIQVAANAPALHADCSALSFFFFFFFSNFKYLKRTSPPPRK